MKKPKQTTWKQMTVRLPLEVHRALKVRAAEEDKSVAVIVEGLVREYLVQDQVPLTPKEAGKAVRKRMQAAGTL